MRDKLVLGVGDQAESREIDGGIRLELVLETYGCRSLQSAQSIPIVRGLPLLQAMVLVTGDRRLAGYPVAGLQV